MLRIRFGFQYPLLNQKDFNCQCMISKYILKDYKGALSDYTRAIEIEGVEAPNYNNNYLGRGKSIYYLGRLALILALIRTLA